MSKEFRPSKLSEVFGQEHLKPIINKWINNPKDIPKALLFHGPYGCTKTTFARMLANVLASNPSDIHEINAANTNGIDDVRAIADDTLFAGFGTAKVYILDEFHSMTKQAQEALLKVIEEPKEGIYFMFCTTDVQKLIPTVRSRCTALEVRTLSETEAFALMKFLSPEITEDMMVSVYMSSGGHARDIVKAVSVGLVNPQAIQQLAVNISNAQSVIHEYFNPKEGGNANPWELLNADESYLRMLCDQICDNPSILGSYFNKENYQAMLVNRANSLVFLISQKQRFLHLISLRYPSTTESYLSRLQLQG
jgi:DNA polymerase III gamma/tau subunit